MHLTSFVQILVHLKAKPIPDPSMPFGSFLKTVNITLTSKSFSVNQLKIDIYCMTLLVKYTIF